jgi:hypothetical protein
MGSNSYRKPDFLIIGAQKSGTTWLWQMIHQHPETDLPSKKEIHYFGGSENYQRGRQWYYEHFAGLDENKVTGEASTTYLFDDVPFWYNPTTELVFDRSLPSIPELVRRELGDVKIIAILRNPIHRAVSAYKHLMKRAAVENRPGDVGISPALRLEDMARNFPKKRILEYGFYTRYLKQWLTFFPPQQLKVFIFEEDLLENPRGMIQETYRFLGIDPGFSPVLPEKKVNKTWTWTRIYAAHHLPGFLKGFVRNRSGQFLDRHDVLRKKLIRPMDITFLKNVYADEKKGLEDLLGREIPWDV